MQHYHAASNLFAAPYDWRLAPDSLELNGFYDNLTLLIDTVYNYTNRAQKITIYAVSDGAMVVLSYLEYMATKEGYGQGWIQQRVCGWIPDSGESDS